MSIPLSELGKYQIESFDTRDYEGSDESNERTEDVKECELCEGKGFDETISDCCGDSRDADTGLCYHCHDHSDPSICPDCNGTGIKA